MSASPTPATAPSSAPSITAALCLCAPWCATCRAYRSTLEALAAEHPGIVFSWIDLEDLADVVGDYDVENLPTLLLASDAGVHFLGPLLPQAGVLRSLLLCRQPPPITDADTLALWARIQNAQAAGRLPSLKSA